MAAQHSHTGKIHDIPVALVVTVGIVSAVLLLLVMLLSECMAYIWQQRVFEARVVEQPFLEIEELRETQREALHAPPTWVDREAGVVRIPIDLAIERYAEEH